MSSTTFFPVLAGGHVGPLPQWSRQQLAHIRGAMWTLRLNCPYGPRPGQDSNILAMDFYELFNADTRKRMIEKYKRAGCTHAATGPIFDAGGYHGLYPTQTDISQRAWDRYLDAMDEWHAADIIPVHFVKPDNWTLEMVERYLEPLYAQPRAKALLPMLVPAGWEPFGYETSSRTWATFFDWAARVNPDALVYAHSVCDVDALKGSDALYNDEPEPNALAWQYHAPKLHGWLAQFGGYIYGDRSPAALATWRANLAEYFVDNRKRFVNGKAGWPTGSRWGADVPLPVYYGEGGSFKFFNDASVPESEVAEWGDIAIQNGAAGTLDSCSPGLVW